MSTCSILCPDLDLDMMDMVGGVVDWDSEEKKRNCIVVIIALEPLTSEVERAGESVHSRGEKTQGASDSVDNTIQNIDINELMPLDIMRGRSRRRTQEDSACLAMPSLLALVLSPAHLTRSRESVANLSLALITSHSVYLPFISSFSVAKTFPSPSPSPFPFIPHLPPSIPQQTGEGKSNKKTPPLLHHILLCACKRERPP